MADDFRYFKNARIDGAAVDTGGGTDASDTRNDKGVGDVDAQNASGYSGLPVEPDSEAIRRLEGALDEARDQHLRLAAEFDNYRKRVARERSELTARAQADLATRLLDALDDTDRLTATMGTLSIEALREAVALVDKKFWKELEAAGLEAIDPAGQPFDPSLHEAVSAVAPPSPDKDHTVASTFQIGYRFKGTLVRPARVQVYSEQGQA